jgi:hypothetical protein
VRQSVLSKIAAHVKDLVTEIATLTTTTIEIVTDTAVAGRTAIGTETVVQTTAADATRDETTEEMIVVGDTDQFIDASMFSLHVHFMLRGCSLSTVKKPLPHGDIARERAAQQCRLLRVVDSQGRAW